MQLVKINVIRVQAAQGSVDGIEQVFSGVASVPSSGPHFPATLRGEDKSGPLVSEPAARDELSTAGLRARGVYIGGIDEVNTCLSRRIEHSMRLLFMRLLSERSRSEDHAGDCQAGPAKVREPHEGPFFSQVSQAGPQLVRAANCRASLTACCGQPSQGRP